MARKRCIFSPPRRDLNEILIYIGKSDPWNAVAFVDRLESICKRFVRFPELGRAREELGAGIRSYPVDRYVIFYRILDGDIEIVRALHGARDIERVFAGKVSNRSKAQTRRKDS
jgi:toxin ParE1/3/4